MGVLEQWRTIRCIRDIYDGQVAWAWPVSVVGGGQDYLLAAHLAGSVGMVPEGYPNDLHRLLEQVSSGIWCPVALTWQQTNCLHVVQPDRWWGTRLMWDAETDEFLCWYIDFRLPVVRSGEALNTRDLALDIVVRPDGQWRWKDEDHYQFSLDMGYINGAEHAAVEAARELVVAEIEERRFPFTDDLLDWQLPAELPSLPETWATP